MKKLFVLTFAIAMTMAASAQITWNAKLGVGFSSCTTDGNAELEKLFVGKIGVGIEYPLSPNISLMPSLELAMKGAKEKGSSIEIRTNYLQLPMVAAYRFNLSADWNITTKVGPYFAYAFSGNLRLNSKDYDIFSSSDMGGETANRFDAGIDIGIDFEYHRFVIGAEYERGFVNFFPSGSNYAKVYNQAFYVTVGYKF